MRKILYFMIPVALLTACTKEIDFDFNEIDPLVVIEGKVTNEGRSVLITRSRSVTDSVHARCLQGANVVISDGITATSLTYDAATDSYYSPIPGTANQTYHLSVDFEGTHYEASSTMPAAAPIISSVFMWLPMMDSRMLCYEMWAVDPEPDVRNYYWVQMLRISHHPHFEGKSQTAPFAWDLFDDRGCQPGTLFIDWMIASEQSMDEDKEENWKRLLYDGDSVSLRLMSVDPQVYNYLLELGAGQHNGANPHSNITGGCLGYFAACAVSHTDTIVFNRSNLKERRR